MNNTKPTPFRSFSTHFRTFPTHFRTNQIQREFHSNVRIATFEACCHFAPPTQRRAVTSRRRHRPQANQHPIQTFTNHSKNQLQQQIRNFILQQQQQQQNERRLQIAGKIYIRTTAESGLDLAAYPQNGYYFPRKYHDDED